MSAINTVVSAGAAFMITDAARYYIRGALAGIVKEFGDKAVAPSHLKMVIASCGAPEIRDMFSDECRRFATFDDAIRGLPTCAREMAAAGYFTRVFDNPDDSANRFRLFVAGWSDERRRPETYCMQAHNSVSDAGAIKPFTMVCAPILQCQPGGVGMETLRALGFLKGNQLSFRDPASFLTTIIDWQRRNCKFSEVANRYCIGGYATLTRVDANGVTQSVVQKWSDVEGELIDPTRDAAPSDAPTAAIPEGLSRLQRQRLEKKARKGTLRAA